MKKTALIFLLVAFNVHLTAQISEGGLPPSYKAPGTKAAAAVAAYRLQAIDTAGLADYNREKAFPLRYAVLEEVDLDLRKAGTKSLLPDGSTLWQYRINSPDGLSLQVIFRKFLIPEGARLFLFDEAYTHVRGAFTNRNITEDLSFVTADLPGDHMIIEYNEPADVPFGGEVIIGRIGQAYVDIFGLKSANIDQDGYIPVNCEEGIPYQDQKHAVCKYSFNDGVYSYLCSGSLINNTRNDGTPYFLTAAHCISTATEASSIVAWFNYEEASCTGVSLYSSQTLTGSSLMTTGSMSDYTLLKFRKPVPPSYMPYFAGWDITDTPPRYSAGIHHPHGRTKKISLDYDQAQSVDRVLSWESGGSSPANSHWNVFFDDGITSSGSSGSPLLDQNGRITGQLHGGSSNDYYGKMSYSWSHPNSSYEPLSTYLDPDTTGVKTVDGYYPPENLPDAQFLSDFSAVCLDAPFDLTGFSAFDPLGWEWTFRPSGVTYYDGTTSSSPSPRVSLNSAGPYSVTLRVTNAAGQGALTLENYITAGSSLKLSAYPMDLTDSCIFSFTGVAVEACGADAYLWTLSDNSDDLFYLENNTVNPAVIRVRDGVELTESTDIELTITGIQGTCQSLLAFSIPLEAQTNDNVMHAVAIAIGENGPFSNKCATIQDREPVPPYDSCTGQLSWCDEYSTGEDIIENSVWFSFTPEVNQKIMLASMGMDNQVAVYRTDSPQDLLAGNYTLIGANDDFTDTDYNARISSMDVEAGRKYLIQVDGSGGGLEGSFYLTLSVLSSTGELSAISEEIRVYPQPAGDVVTIESAAFAGCREVRVELIDNSGRVICQELIAESSGRLQLPLGDLPKGVYFARIYCGSKVTVTKVVL
ncbi:MAG: trypsin-like peptidase domain-containing protein [Bacteroidales bacterium]|jgi:PKD repeat protein|nr:trypsin-like peptidase domain-containing protein [Bacteroidales bacterium]